MMNKIALAVIALGISGVANAGMYTPAPAPVAPAACSADSVTVPCAANRYVFGIQGLYVQPNAISDVTQQVTGFGTDSVLTNSQEFHPQWLWGFRLEAGYQWGTGLDLNLNWSHFDNTDSVTTLGAPSASSAFFGQFVEDPANYDSLNGQTGYWDSITTSVDNKFDAVNLELGQRVNFGQNVSARFHAGLQYARIQQNVTQSGVLAVPAVPTQGVDIDTSGVATSNSKFTGIGPRVGMDLSYGFGNGFAIVGSLAGSLLIGSTDLTATSSLTTLDTGTSTSTTTSASANSTYHHVVPGLEEKLGVEFTHPCAQGDLVLQAGYTAAQYWSSVQRGTTTTSDNLVNVASLGSYYYGLNSGSQDFAYNGIYFGAKWVGNA